MEDELVAGLTLQQLQVVTAVLYFYERHMWNFVAPSVKRTRQLTDIHLLLVKIPLLASAKIGIFTPAEVGYIEAAFRAFIVQAEEKIPQSESRDAVIDGCKELCDYLINALTPPRK